MIDFDWSIPAAGFGLLAKWMLGKRQRAGWAVAVLAGLFWHYVAWHHEIWGQLTLSFVIQAVNIRGYILWSRRDKRDD